MGICEWNKGTCWHLTTDPDTTQRRLEAMERARMKLQEEHDAKAAMYAEQQKQVSIYVWPNSCRQKCKLCLIAVLLNTHQTGGRGIYNIVYILLMGKAAVWIAVVILWVLRFLMLCQKEEERRKQKIEEWENLQDGKGYRSKVKPVSISYM